MAEARVRAFKEALDHVMPAGAKDLNFAEFDALLKKVSNLVNDRPLGVKRSGNTEDGEILPISPNMLLLGRSAMQPPEHYVEPEDENKLTLRTKFIEEVETLWWKLWYCQIFENLFPRHKWKDPSENL